MNIVMINVTSEGGQVVTAGTIKRIIVLLLSILLGMMGLDFVTALSGAATSISNVGPGLGNLIGANGNFATVPDAAKWVMAFGMLLGRLELFTVLVMLTPAFWSR